MPLQVKETKVGRHTVNAFGITDGKKWFFYAYSTKESADALLPHFDTEIKIRVNISHPMPYQLV